MSHASPLHTPSFREMKRPLSTLEAAMVAAGVSLTTPTRVARRLAPVKRYQSQIQKACILYDDPNVSEERRRQDGIPSAWDGGCRVIEQKQITWWKERKFEKSKRPKYLRHG